MAHYLTMGHFDYQLPNTLHISVRRPIDKDLVVRILREMGKVDDQGNMVLGGAPVEFENGCVVCLWIAAAPIPEAAEFAQRLHEATNCAVIDREHGIEIYRERRNEPDAD